MFNLVLLWLPAIIGGVVRYFFGSRKLVFLATTVLIPLVSSCAIAFLLDPLTQSDPIRAVAYYTSAAISAVVGSIAGKLLRDYETK
jgi:cation transporter-like permease